MTDVDELSPTEETAEEAALRIEAKRLLEEEPDATPKGAEQLPDDVRDGLITDD